jgi:hypothetical protein
MGSGNGDRCSRGEGIGMCSRECIIVLNDWYVLGKDWYVLGKDWWYMCLRSV